MTSISTDEIGVVAIGRNEGKRLIACLASIKAKTSNLVYVDSGSVDASVAAATELGAAIVNLDLARPFTAARARNEGFAALMALRPDVQFVQFIDGDCILAPDWLDLALPLLMERQDIAIVCGRRRELHPEASLYNHLADVEWDTPIGEALACGGDALVRVEAFKAIGGFSSHLIAGEEPELCLRLRERGWKIWRLDAEMTQHDLAMTGFSQWWARALRSGYGMSEVYYLHRNSPQSIWGRETTSFVFWGGLVPVFVCFGALLHPAIFAGILIYPLQIARVAYRRGIRSRESWIFALLMMLAKFAGFQGLLRLLWRRWRGGAIRLIEYK